MKYYLKMIFSESGVFVKDAPNVIREYAEAPTEQLKKSNQIIGKSISGRDKYLRVKRHSGEVFESTKGAIFRIRKAPRQ